MAYPSAPPPKRGLSTGATIGLLAGALAFVVLICSAGVGGVLYFDLRNNPDSSASTSPADPGDTVHSIVYSATSTDGTIFQVDYYDDSGTVHIDNLRASPWTDSETIDSDDAGYITLNVHNNDEYDGALSCTITVDGELVDTESTSGTFESAVCGTALD